MVYGHYLINRFCNAVNFVRKKFEFHYHYDGYYAITFLILWLRRGPA